MFLPEVNNQSLSFRVDLEHPEGYGAVLLRRHWKRWLLLEYLLCLTSYDTVNMLELVYFGFTDKSPSCLIPLLELQFYMLKLFISKQHIKLSSHVN